MNSNSRVLEELIIWSNNCVAILLSITFDHGKIGLKHDIYPQDKPQKAEDAAWKDF